MSKNFFQDLIDKGRSKINYQKAPQPYEAPLVNKERYLYSLGMNETSIIPEENRYTFSQPSGRKALGLALGKYQVTEGTQPIKCNTIPDSIFLLLSGIFNIKISVMNLFTLFVDLVLIVLMVLMVYKVVGMNTV